MKNSRTDVRILWYDQALRDFNEAALDYVLPFTLIGQPPDKKVRDLCQRRVKENRAEKPKNVC